jgi:hypothetical protein
LYYSDSVGLVIIVQFLTGQRGKLKGNNYIGNIRYQLFILDLNFVSEEVESNSGSAVTRSAEQSFGEMEDSTNGKGTLET